MKPPVERTDSGHELQVFPTVVVTPPPVLQEARTSARTEEETCECAVLLTCWVGDSEMRAFLIEGSVPVSVDDLRTLGVTYNPIPVGDTEALESLCRARGYKNRDEVKLFAGMEGLEDKLKMFYKEHLHEDEEIRYILDGEGFFDVRNKEDQWVRIVVEKNDLIIVPAGLYHRFGLTESRRIHAMRLFSDAPKWTPIYRPGAD